MGLRMGLAGGEVRKEGKERKGKEIVGWISQRWREQVGTVRKWGTGRMAYEREGACYTSLRVEAVNHECS